MFTYDDARHEYTLDGQKIPSLTQMLDRDGWNAHLDQAPAGVVNAKAIWGTRLHCALLAAEHRIRGGIEIRVVVIALIEGRCEFPPQSQVQSKFRGDPIIVLRVERVDELAEIDHRIAALIDGVRQAEDEIREAVAGGIARAA